MKRKNLGVHPMLARHHRMSRVQDYIMLQMRMFREVIAAKEGTEETWGELAGIINVFGIYASHARNEAALQDMCAAADALRAIEDRHNRVGGRWSATESELAGLTKALNTIDNDLMPTMPIVDFVRIATEVNEISRRERAAVAQGAAHA